MISTSKKQLFAVCVFMSLFIAKRYFVAAWGNDLYRDALGWITGAALIFVLAYGAFTIRQERYEKYD